MSGGGVSSGLEEEKMKAVKKNLMSSLEGEVEDDLEDIDKADLDMFMNMEEVEVNKEGK